MAAGMLKRWRFAEDGLADAPADVNNAACREFARAAGVHPLVAHLLLRRGVDSPQRAEAFLKPKLTQLHDPVGIPGLARAAERLTQAVRNKQPIVIYGDYDVDGVTASAILWHTLKEAGADVHTYVPHRIEEGYGLNPEAIRAIANGEWGTGKGGGMADGGWRMADGKTEARAKPLIISVDCGITAVEPARVARECGVDLIITDHHEFDADNLPDAYAIVHPRLPSDKPYAFPNLCGAGVAFKVAWQFAKTFCGGGERLPAAFRDLLVDLLSFAALGTVADIVPLIDENRVITTHGLGRIKRTRFTGLNALIDASRLRDEKIDAYHVGFVLGPRLNACGRMGHAKQAVHMLTAAGQVEAVQIAEFLTQENDRRRATEREIFEQAKKMVIELGYDREDCRAIVVGKEGWHPGVVGIVASRLVEAFARPAIVLNFSEGAAADSKTPGEGSEAHGSARSVEGVSIHEAISHCASHLTKFGGHAMAAGLTLATSSVDEFRAALVGFVNGKLAPEDLVTLIDIDAECSLDDLTPEVVEQINRLAPFGAGNPSPTFCMREATVEQAGRRMGQAGKHLNVMLRQGKRMMRAVAWNMGDLAEKLPAGARVGVAFEPKISEWQGVRRVELHVADVRFL